VTLLAVAAVGEGVVRYRERHRDTVPGTMPLLYYRHSRLGHALVRDNDYFGWVHINKQGFRGADVSLTKPAGVFRILAIGSSTTFDPGVTRDDRAWPARLEYWLSQQQPGRRIEVINAGVPGYRVVDDVIRLTTELYRYRPDLIVLYEGHNDLFANLRWTGGAPEVNGAAPGEVDVETPWGHWLTRNSLMYTKMVARYQAIKFSMLRRPTAPASGGQTIPVVDRGAADPVARATTEFSRDLHAFLAVARALEIPVALPSLVQVSGVGATEERDPHQRWMWANGLPFATPEEILRGYALYNAAIDDAATRFGATSISTAEFGLKGAALYAPDDPIHFNDRGSEIMARKLAEALVARGAIGAAKEYKESLPTVRAVSAR
jgi:lysophospholipase L1-like esterase